MDPGILGHAICEACRSARDMSAMTIAVCGRRQPVQRKALPDSATTAVSRLKLLMLGVDALQSRRHHDSMMLEAHKTGLSRVDLPVCRCKTTLMAQLWLYMECGGRSRCKYEKCESNFHGY